MKGEIMDYYKLAETIAEYYSSEDFKEQYMDSVIERAIYELPDFLAELHKRFELDKPTLDQIVKMEKLIKLWDSYFIQNFYGNDCTYQSLGRICYGEQEIQICDIIPKDTKQIYIDSFIEGLNDAGFYVDSNKEFAYFSLNDAGLLINLSKLDNEILQKIYRDLSFDIDELMI